MTSPFAHPDFFDRVADLLRPEGAWIKGETARTGNNRTVASNSKDAVCWCLLGAVTRIREELQIFDYAYWVSIRAILTKAMSEVDTIYSDNSFPAMAAWNDRPERTKEEVLSALALASQKLKEAEAQDEV